MQFNGNFIYKPGNCFLHLRIWCIINWNIIIIISLSSLCEKELLVAGFLFFLRHSVVIKYELPVCNSIASINVIYSTHFC